MTARALARRVARMEKALPPPAPGCDACRGRLVLGLGQYTEEQVGDRNVYRCATCRRQLVEGVRLITIDLEAVI